MTASEAVLVDSSGWLEYLTNDTKADSFASYLEGQLVVLVPTVVVYEVRKILRIRQRNTLADTFLSHALGKTVVPFDDLLAIKSAELSVHHKLSMADAIIYATARHYEAQLITSDAHFTNLPRVTLI